MMKQNNIDKIEETIERPVKRVFRFFRIDEDRQRKISEDIKGRAESDLTFVILTIFSTIIVALGLIINNAAVVIGGMIIASLLWPILALAMADIKGNGRSSNLSYQEYY